MSPGEWWLGAPAGAGILRAYLLRAVRARQLATSSADSLATHSPKSTTDSVAASRFLLAAVTNVTDTNYNIYVVINSPLA